MERMSLFVDGLWRFAPTQNSNMPGRRYRRKPTARYGQVRNIAIDYVAGKYHGMTITEVASEKRIAYESLKAAVWRVGNPRVSAQVKAVA
jgi:hypothetical protein